MVRPSRGGNQTDRQSGFGPRRPRGQPDREGDGRARGDSVRVRAGAGVAAPAVAAAVVVPAKPAAERPVVITPAPVRTPKSAPASAEPYVIQVVTYPSVQDAGSIVKTLKNSGFRAFVKESARPSGRVFYMVLIGGFRTAAEAQSQLLKFRGQEVARPFQDAFVRTNRS